MHTFAYCILLLKNECAGLVCCCLLFALSIIPPQPNHNLFSQVAPPLYVSHAQSFMSAAHAINPLSSMLFKTDLL